MTSSHTSITATLIQQRCAGRKEDRSDWVMVEPGFYFRKGARNTQSISAYQFFQRMFQTVARNCVKLLLAGKGQYCRWAQRDKQQGLSDSVRLLRNSKAGWGPVCRRNRARSGCYTIDSGKSYKNTERSTVVLDTYGRVKRPSAAKDWNGNILVNQGGRNEKQHKKKGNTSNGNA
jgi:hypothetical protein